MFRVVRILYAQLVGTFRAKINPTQEVRLKMRVWPGEVDLTRVNQAMYLFYCELGRWDIIQRSGMKPFIAQHKCIPVVASQMIRITRSLKRLQTFELRSHFSYWDEKWFYIDHSIISEGKLIAAAQVRGLFKGVDKNFSTYEILKSMGLDPTSPPAPQRILSWIEAENLLVVEKKSKL